MTTADTTSRQIAEYFVQMMDAIGVKVQIDSFAWPEFSAALRNRKAQMWTQAWSADYPDAENFAARRVLHPASEAEMLDLFGRAELR